MKEPLGKTPTDIAACEKENYVQEVRAPFQMFGPRALQNILWERRVGQCVSAPISLDPVPPPELPPFNSSWGGRKGLVCGHRENVCLQGCPTCLHPEDYRNFLIKAKFVGSLVFWCGSCSWKTGLRLRLYCLPMAQQPATHISEPTPHKQPRSYFFRAGRVRRAWDHHDMEGPPLLIVSWGLDHPRVPRNRGGILRWQRSGSGDLWRPMTKFLFLALTFYNTQARMEWEGAWGHSDPRASSHQGVVSIPAGPGPCFSHLCIAAFHTQWAVLKC